MDLPRLLYDVLGVDNIARRHAEHQLRQMAERVQHYGLQLTLVASDPSQPLPLKVLALVMLKNFVREFWGQVAEEERAQIRMQLFMLLADPCIEPRASLPFSIIVAADFPDRWPTLPKDIAFVLDGTPSQYGVAIRILIILCESLNQQQLRHFMPLSFQLAEQFLLSAPNSLSCENAGFAYELMKILNSFVTIIGVENDCQLAAELPRYGPVVNQLAARSCSAILAQFQHSSDAEKAIRATVEALALWRNTLSCTKKVLPTNEGVRSLLATLEEDTDAYEQRLGYSSSNTMRGTQDFSTDGFQLLISNKLDMLLVLLKKT